MIPTLASIFSAVSSASGLPVAAIRGRRRTRVLVLARFAAVILLRERFPWWSLQQLAEVLGRIDHGTAIHALARAACLEADDEQFRRLLAMARNHLASASQDR